MAQLHGISIKTVSLERFCRTVGSYDQSCERLNNNRATLEIKINKIDTSQKLTQQHRGKAQVCQTVTLQHMTSSCDATHFSFHEPCSKTALSAVRSVRCNMQELASCRIHILNIRNEIRWNDDISSRGSCSKFWKQLFLPYTSQKVKKNFVGYSVVTIACEYYEFHVLLASYFQTH